MIYFSVGILYVLVGSADTLLGYLSFSTWVVCLCGAISVLIFRRTMPNAPRPFNAGIVAPIIFIVAMTLLTLVNVIYNPFDILVGILILLSGLPVYWLFILNRPTSVDKFSRTITVYLQKLLLLVPDNNKQHD
jgi:amino acid transporter